MSTRTKAIYGLLLHYFGSADCRIVCACQLIVVLFVLVTAVNVP
jgi:hypothetical protein